MIFKVASLYKNPFDEDVIVMVQGRIVTSGHASDDDANLMLASNVLETF